MDNKKLTINRIRNAIDAFCKNHESNDQIRRFRRALSRCIYSSKAKELLDSNNHVVVGYLGSFYMDNEYELRNSTSSIRRLVVGNKIKFFNNDNAYDPIKNPEGIRYKWENTELVDNKRYAVLHYDSKILVLKHKVGDVLPSTNQVFIKIPKLRTKVGNDKFKLVDDEHNKILVKNIKCNISIVELLSWIECDVDDDNPNDDSPYYTIDDNHYTPLFIELCEYLNKNLGFNIKLW